MDIVVFGPIATWEITARGQRIAQMIEHWLEDGHRVLYVSLGKDNNPERFETDNFKLHLFCQDTGAWTNDHAHCNHILRKQLLEKALDEFETDGDMLAVFEIPVPDYAHLPELMRARGYKVVYELIDKWEEMPPYGYIRQPHYEKQIVHNSHVLVGTSKALVRELIGKYRRADTYYIPNACNRDKFNPNMAKPVMPFDMQEALVKGAYNPSTDTIVYYQGAIGANWFWWELLYTLATTMPNMHFVLVGWWWQQDNFTRKNWEDLIGLKNVHYLGRKEHEECVSYCFHSEICIVPFRDMPMIHATSPNKVFEYLSLYKPVIDLGEETRGMPLVYHARTVQEWREKLEHISEMIRAGAIRIDKHLVDNYLAGNTWKHRADALLETQCCHMAGTSQIASQNYVVWEDADYKNIEWTTPEDPVVSIIMLNMNGSTYTIPAIRSLRKNTAPCYELIVVDNGSASEEVAFLEQYAQQGIIDRLILLDKNYGFAGGNNKGAEVAKGKYHCYVNNDLIFHPRWLTAMLSCMDETVGLVGSVSNNIGSRNNPQRVFFKNQLQGQVKEVERLSGCCVLVNVEKLGAQPWDNDFSQVDKGAFGNFEDDDISVRSKNLGLKNLVAGDSYVHHKMLSTFTDNKLDTNFSYEFNKKVFEEKHPNEKPHWWEGRSDISNEGF